MHRDWNRWVARAAVVGLLAVLCVLGAFSLLTQQHVATRSDRADRAIRTSAVYQDARFWVGQEESLERQYRLEPGPGVLAQYEAAGSSLIADLTRLSSLDRSHMSHTIVRRLLALQTTYADAMAAMFRGVDAHDRARVAHFDAVGDQVYAEMQSTVYGNAAAARRRALAQSAALRDNENAATRASAIAFGVGLALLLAFALIVVRFRRRLDAAQAAEVRRLAEIAITDPLTRLPNHRAFHDDLARSLHRVGRSGVPVALVMLDLDRLKQINDTLGHQTGDKCLRAVADALASTRRGSDGAYRVGGDEFAAILDNSRAWSAVEFVQRFNAALADAREDVRVSASAGISEATAFKDKDTLFREADLALITAKRDAQRIAIYTPEMAAAPDRRQPGHDAHHIQTLANALARAVDAKDAYTRSHSQTVSHLCALIAAELDLAPERVAQIRLAGLLHDVGKIGVPDAVLNKPGKLTADEYRQMQAHSLLGHEIVSAAELPTEALWIRHHHERYDGNGYPDGLAGERIPLEARIIFVADAFEAMTSDRPYRKAPGQQYALEELRRYAGSQFDPEIVAALIRAITTPRGQSAADGDRDPAAQTA